MLNAPRGSHCGGIEICRKSDPPQAENLASEILQTVDKTLLVSTPEAFFLFSVQKVCT